MGGQVSTSKTREEIDASFTANPNTITCWGLHHIQALHRRYQEDNYDFGLDKENFTQLVTDCVPGATSVIDELWYRFDPQAAGLVHGLEVVSAVAAMSIGSLQDKIEFMFTLYDFNGGGEISYDEMVILLCSVLGGIVKLEGKGRVPEDADMEAVTDEAFLDANHDASGNITKSEFARWVRKVINADGGDLTVDDLLTKFGLSVDEDAGDEELKDDDEEEEDGASAGSGNDSDSDLAAETSGGGAGAWPRADALDLEMEAQEPGDQFTAVKPWLGAMHEPSAPPAPDASEPENDLELEFVHGYRAADVRNNVRELATHQLVYFTAALGVVLDPHRREQRFYFGHTDDVVSMAVHPDGITVATGQVGKRPEIHIWNSQTMKVIRVLRRFHKRAVLHLAFSHSGRYLASVGQDESHSLAVYDWHSESAARVPSFSAKVDRNKVLDLAWAEDDTRIATVGVRHVAFWELAGQRQLRRAKGVFGKQGSIQPILSVAAFAGSILTGTASGRLYLWNGRECQGGPQHHQGPVNCLWAAGEHLYSGGKDGKVRKYDRQMHVVATVDLAASTDSKCPRVRSVATNADGQLVVGTQGAEIYTFAAALDGQTPPVKCMEGHFKGELWGLAVHPLAHRYVTTGDDHMLRVWDVPERRCVATARLDSAARAVCYSPDGGHVAVGTGARPVPRINGAFRVYEGTSLALLHKAQDSQRWIEEIKYSPDGAVLAVGSHDAVIYLYDATNNYAKLHELRGHSSYITHLDFTADSAALQSNCGAYELLYWDVASGAQRRSGGSELKDAEWGTWTCTLGWPVQGIWPRRSDGTDVNAVDRSKDGSTLVTADDFGTVKLFRFPSTEPGAACTEYEGHSSHVTNARFGCDDTFAVTTGGNDRSVFQWRYRPDEEPDAAAVLPEAELSDEMPAESCRGAPLDAIFDIELAGSAAGDQFTAIKPWTGAIKPPTHPPPEDTGAPAEDLVLEWVHGYQAQAVRNSLRYTASGNIVYTVAALGVVFNQHMHTQHYYTGHTDDIISLAISSDGRLVATGELGKRPQIHVWDADTRQRLATLGGHRRGVCQLAFSHDGTRLASIGLDDDHSIAVHDWANEALLLRQKCHKGKVLGVSFTPDDDSIVTVGEKHMAFWRANGGRSLKKSKGLFGKVGSRQTVHSVACFNHRVVTGQQDGSLYVWDGREVERAVEAHHGAAYALFATPDALFTGGRDGNVCRFDSAFTKQHVGHFEDQKIRSVCAGPTGMLLVGTSESQIVEIEAGTQTVRHEGHCRGETWGLAAHPTRGEYVTTGDDRTMRVWDVDSRKLLRKKTLEAPVRAAAWSPDGSLIALGLGSGSRARRGDDDEGALRVLSADSLEVVHACRDAREWVSDVKFSPNGVTLAVASHDNKIYLYDVATWSAKGVCTGHSSYITHIDFSSDSNYLQSNCGAYELLYWEAATGNQARNGAGMLKDEEWGSWTCTLGWPVQGIWPPFADGTDVNAVDRASSGTLLVTADDFGAVKLFNCPCITPGAGCNEYGGHSSHVTNCRFSCDDLHVISTGGNDRAVFQWRLTVPADGGDLNDSDLEAEGVPAEDADFGVPDFELEAAQAGDQFMAVKPWLGAMHAPTLAPHVSPESPDAELELEWVHGYRSHDTRNNLVALASGEVCYHAAAVGIVYSRETHRQRFYRGHTGAIISLALHPDGVTVATGQVGKRPEVHVWNSATMETVCIVKGLHRRGVPNVCFSDDGSLLLTTGQDGDNRVALYESATGEFVAWAKGHTDKLLDAAMAPDGTVCVVGVNVVKFWPGGDLSARPKKGLWGRKGKLQPVLSVQFVEDTAVTGTASGHLYLWTGRELTRAIQAHSRAVNALAKTADGGLVSGAKDGIIKIWNGQFSTIAEYNVSGADIAGARLGLPNMPPDPNDRHYFPSPLAVQRPNAVRAVHETAMGGLVFGTHGGEIMELHNGKSTVLHEAHCSGETWGLAVHPAKAEFVTTGDDHTVRVWSVGSRKLLRKRTFESRVRAAAWSPDGSLIAIAFGGPGAEAGAFRVLNADNLEVVHSGQDSREWVQDLRFSPDGNTLAIASHDNKIYLYDVTTWSAKGTCAGHSSYVTHIDFSADSRFLQSNCGAYELLYWDTANGNQVRDGGSMLKDEGWASWTCTLGWPVQDIWPDAADGTDVNAVDRSHSGALAVTADDFGTVKLFHYPVIPGVACNEYSGHASHVTNCRWTNTDRHVITVGGADKSVFQWRHRAGPPADEVQETAQAVVGDDAPDGDDDEFALFALEAPDQAGGDQFSAVKPWTGAIVEPSALPDIRPSGEPPRAELALEWVHGYQAQAMRNSARYVAGGCIAYSVAAVGVVFDPNTHAQRFFRGHADDIISLAVSPDGRFVATGELGKRPQVHVWDAASCRRLATLQGHLRRGAAQLAFSPDGRRLAAVGLGAQHTLAVYDWRAEALVARARTGSAKILALAFAPDSATVAAAGAKVVALFAVNGRRLVRTKGLFGSAGTIQTVLTAEFLPDGKLLTGQMDGSLYVWEGRRCVGATGAHRGAVAAMSVVGSKVLTGGDDGVVKLWDGSLNATEVATFDSRVRSVASAPSGDGAVLVGTVNSEIVEHAHGEARTLVAAHSAGETWGLAAQPGGAQFATVGDDRTLRVWAAGARRLEMSAELPCAARACCYSPDGSLIAVGLGSHKLAAETGSFMVFAPAAGQLEMVHRAQDSRQWISDVKFSPDGATLAVASHDNKIYLYNVGAGYALKAELAGHSSYISHMDFSSDSRYLQSNCGAYELLYWDVEAGQQDPAGASKLRDEGWGSWTCTLGWPVQGIWPPMADGTDINAVDRRNDLLVTADDSGRVKLFNCPVVVPGAAHKVARGHSSHVTNCRFVSDTLVVSVGGRDRGVFQWGVVG